MKRALRVLGYVQSTGTQDPHRIAVALVLPLAAVRRDLRALREAGALAEAAAPETAAAANDGAMPPPVLLTPVELALVREGARTLVREGDGTTADGARKVLKRLDRAVGVAEPVAVFVPPTPEAVRQLRWLLQEAIATRRVVALRYRREGENVEVPREVEPLAVFYTADHWSFLAYCRLRQDYRSFRLDHVRDLRLTDAWFQPRQGASLERYIHARKNATAAGGRR
ncbi:MAG: WYL domain-containing protein [Deltaproteobacteria bacterium]|nr:WYL domain-containing protein [Deltaproteobacteria bacterium]